VQLAQVGHGRRARVTRGGEEPPSRPAKLSRVFGAVKFDLTFDLELVEIV
jgi:hypothetical protein